MPASAFEVCIVTTTFFFFPHRCICDNQIPPLAMSLLLVTCSYMSGVHCPPLLSIRVFKFVCKRSPYFPMGFFFSLDSVSWLKCFPSVRQTTVVTLAAFALHTTYAALFSPTHSIASAWVIPPPHPSKLPPPKTSVSLCSPTCPPVHSGLN